MGIVSFIASHIIVPILSPILTFFLCAQICGKKSKPVKYAVLTISAISTIPVTFFVWFYLVQSVKNVDLFFGNEWGDDPGPVGILFIGIPILGVSYLICAALIFKKLATPKEAS